jgi:hypothetical protein
MADSNRRDFLKKGATAVVGIGAVGAAGFAAGCVADPEAATASELPNSKFVLNEAKYRQLTAFPDVRQEFVSALDEVTDGLISDPAAYASFMESSDAVASLRVWDANAALLTQLVGETDGTTKRGRLKRLLTVSELYDGAGTFEPGFLDSPARSAYLEESSSSSSSSSSSVSSGGDCATNGSATNGCCVIHTWGWSAGDGRCSGTIEIAE